MLKKNEEDGVVAEGPTSETPDQFFLPLEKLLEKRVLLSEFSLFFSTGYELLKIRSDLCVCIIFTIRCEPTYD